MRFFVLAFTLLAGVSAQVFDPNCLDTLPDCDKYGQESCTKFTTWAQDKCKNFCRYCIGPTKPAAPCVNTLADCEQYGRAACTDPKYKDWAENHCRYFCRLCPSDVLAKLDAVVTTLSPAACVDRVNCREYTKSACVGNFVHWAKINCPVFCGFCPTGVTPAPSCVDAIPNCAVYDANVCSDTHYRLWVEDNCRKHCGVCGNGGKPVVGTPGPVTQGPMMPTPHMVVTPHPIIVSPQLGK